MTDRVIIILSAAVVVWALYWLAGRGDKRGKRK